MGDGLVWGGSGDADLEFRRSAVTLECEEIAEHF